MPNARFPFHVRLFSKNFAGLAPHGPRNPRHPSSALLGNPRNVRDPQAFSRYNSEPLRVSPSGKAPASQAGIRGFESRHPLQCIAWAPQPDLLRRLFASYDALRLKELVMREDILIKKRQEQPYVTILFT